MRSSLDNQLFPYCSLAAWTSGGYSPGYIKRIDFDLSYETSELELVGYFQSFRAQSHDRKGLLIDKSSYHWSEYLDANTVLPLIEKLESTFCCIAGPQSGHYTSSSPAYGLLIETYNHKLNLTWHPLLRHNNEKDDFEHIHDVWELIDSAITTDWLILSGAKPGVLPAP